MACSEGDSDEDLSIGTTWIREGNSGGPIAHRLAIPELSTGDILRAADSAGTSIGRKANAAIERGELVPDELVVAIVAERILQPDAKNGFILDGCPRTVAQAEALNDILLTGGLNLDCVLELKVGDFTLRSSRCVNANPAHYIRVCRKGSSATSPATRCGT
jgi:adenylate kinase